jgi:hypothetical protein
MFIGMACYNDFSVFGTDGARSDGVLGQPRQYQKESAFILTCELRKRTGHRLVLLDDP